MRLQACPRSSRALRPISLTGTLVFTFRRAHSHSGNCCGINGRTPGGSRALWIYAAFADLLFLGQSLHCEAGGWAALTSEAPALGTNCGLNLPLSRMLPFGLWLFLFFPGTFALGFQSPHLWQMSPRSLGLTSLSRRLGLGLQVGPGMSDEHTSDCVDREKQTPWALLL